MSDDLSIRRHIFSNSPICHLSTVCEQGRPHVRPMVCHMRADGRFWSATFRDSNKVKHIANNPRANGDHVDDGGRFRIPPYRIQALDRGKQ